MKERPDFCSGIGCPLYKTEKCTIYDSRVKGFSVHYRTLELDRLNRLAATDPNVLLYECASGMVWPDNYRAAVR